MAVLIVNGLSKYWGVDLLFKEIGFLLNAGEKMALVGRNGTGKTTLLQVLMGRMEYDEGSIHMPEGLRVGYLSQDPDFTPGRTLLEEAQSAFAHLQAWERRLRELEALMGATADEVRLAAIMEEYGQITARFETADGYDAPARIRNVLFGLGFTDGDLAKPVEVLSGGQKVRLGLAKLLLEAPDLMLLDEPTNHLDLHATEWLEGYFREMKSAAILVSHDRYFLDRVITRAYELENHTGEIYHGNYSYYLEEKERRQAAAWEAYERNQAEREKLEAFYLKWRMTPTRKDQAMSRKKQLDKMEKLDPPRTRHKAIKLRFDMQGESGDDVLRVENLGRSFGEQVIFRGIDLELFKGDRVALVGPNGAGKTTFLKLAHGLLEPSAGEVRWGVGVKRGYFSQDLDALDYSRTCMEEMLEIPGFTKFDAHSLLGRFLFSGDDVHKQIASCSGGERNRLILAKLVVSGANMLLLDEPTNHLDMESKRVLEEALNEYPGTILFVSHDRYFVDRVATKVWEFAGGGVTQYEGNYSAYRAEKERLALLAAARRSEPPAPARVRIESARPAREERRAVEAARRLEQQIEQLEARKNGLESQLADAGSYKTDRGRELVTEYHAVQGELDRLYAEWEKVTA